MKPSVKTEDIIQSVLTGKIKTFIEHLLLRFPFTHTDRYWCLCMT